MQFKKKPLKSLAGGSPFALRCADLFSRETRRGFDGWGFEHGKFDEDRTGSPRTPLLSDALHKETEKIRCVAQLSNPFPKTAETSPVGMDFR
jgi:hypothetical protein